MGEKQNKPFQLSFNSSLKVDFQGSRVTSEGGLLLVRELDQRLGLSKLIGEHLTDGRRGKNTQLPLPDLLRQSIYSRLAGYEDVNDAERLAQDPTFRLMGSERIWERGAALTSRLQSFETELLTQGENLIGLASINRELIAKAETIHSPQRVAGGKTEPQAGGLVQRLSVSGSQLEDSTQGGGESGVPCRGVIPEGGIHRHQPGDTKPGGGAVLQQTGNGGAVDQGGQAGGKDDAPFLPPFPLQPGAAGLEPAGLQPGELVATAGTAQRNRELVANEFAATVGEDRRTAGETCQVLLADAGGRTSDAAAIRNHAGLYCPVASAAGINAREGTSQSFSSQTCFSGQYPLPGMLSNRGAEKPISRRAAGLQSFGRTEMAIIVQRYVRREP
jgi:Transposase DDE domain group 1